MILCALAGLIPGSVSVVDCWRVEIDWGRRAALQTLLHAGRDRIDLVLGSGRRNTGVGRSLLGVLLDLLRSLRGLLLNLLVAWR
jgi:hypothetical protein